MSKISCVCVTYNRYTNLYASIIAFLNQSYKNKELVIIDDSTNNLPTKIYNIITNNFDVIKYKKLNKKCKIGTKRNKAISLSTGTYIAIWDDDDIHLEHRLQQQVDNLVCSNCDLTVVSHNTLYYFPEHNVMKRIPKIIHDRWWYKGYTCPSMVFKKSVWFKNKYPNVDVNEDYIFLKTLPKNASIHVHKSLKNPFFAYTVNKKGASSFYSYYKKTKLLAT